MKDLLLNNNLLNNQNYITSEKELDYVIKEFPYQIDDYERAYDKHKRKIIHIQISFIVFLFFTLPFFVDNNSKYLNSAVIGYLFGFLSLYMIYILSIYSFPLKERGYEKIRKKKYIFLQRYMKDDSLLKNYIYIKR